MIKTCRKCLIKLPASEFYFRDGKGGLLYAQCKSCKAADHAKWESAHRGRRNFMRSLRRYTTLFQLKATRLVVDMSQIIYSI